MTYCVGLKLDAGIVMMSDTRTNAGLDNISRFRKMFTWHDENRVLAVCCAGNLSITQGVLSRINAAIRQAEEDESVETILNAKTMFRTAQIFGEAMRDVQAQYRESMELADVRSAATMLIGGQRRGGEPRLYLLYSAGNFIEATDDTPFLQIGEHKYGKPILDRVIEKDTPLSQALKAVFLSMDSTLRSNLSVGMPLDMTVMPADEIRFSVTRRIEAEDEDFATISRGWADAIKTGFDLLPAVSVE